MERGRSVPKERLRALFWPSVPDANARHSLRQILYRVRRLGVDLTTTASTVVLNDSAVDADFDVLGRSLTPDGSIVEGAAYATLTVRGAFLDGYAPSFSEPFSAWVEEQRAIVHANLRRALVGAISVRRARGAWSEVDRLARIALALDPLNEEATLCLAEALALAGNKAEAVALLDTYIEEVGPTSAGRLDLAPSLLRRRIQQRFPDTPNRRPLDGEFVGRADSMALLQSMLSQTAAGQGGGCYIWGPPGIGKSRLSEEVIRSAILQGMRTQTITCRTPDINRPLSVFVDLVPRLLALPGAIGVTPEAFALLARLANTEGRSAPISHEATEPEVLAANIRDSILDLLDSLAQEAALVVVIEDIHRADARSRQMLSEIAAWIQGRKLLVVCTSRVPPYDGNPGFSDHRLRPLQSHHAEALFQSLSKGLHEYPSEKIERLLAVAQGNPFYIRELVSYWNQTGDADALPPSISALLDQRLEVLDQTALLALQTVATLERNASIARLSSVLGQSGPELLRALDRLEADGLITGTQDQLRCAHDLVAHAVLGRLSPIAQRVLHRLAAQCLETDAMTSSIPALLWDCSRHWNAAGEPNRAIGLALCCARHLLELGLPHEAAELLKAARPLSRNPNLDEELLALLGIAQHRAVQWNDLLVTLREKRRGAQALIHNDEELMLVDAEYRVGSGDPEALLKRTITCAGDDEASVEHRLGAACQGLIIADGRCDEASAERLFSAVKPYLTAVSDQTVLRLEVAMLYHTAFGDLPEGATAARTLAQQRRDASAPSISARYLRFAAIPLRALGFVAEAEEFVHEAYSIAKKAKLDYAAYGAAVQLANIGIAANNPEKARKWYEIATGITVTALDPLVAFERTLVGIRTYMALGELEKARELFQPVAALQVRDDLRRPACYARALKLRMRLTNARRSFLRDDVEALASAFCHTRARLSQDYCASVLIRGLTALGEQDRAGEVYKEYVNSYRRDRTPLLSELVEAAALR